MEYSIEMESAVCRSPEAETLSGVSQQLQRDWRRRGLISDYTGPGQVRYPLWQVCQLKVMGVMSQANMGLKPASAVISQISSAVASHVRTSLDAAEFIGLDLTDDEKRDVIRRANSTAGLRFTMFRMPELPDGDERPNSFISSTWDGLVEMAQANGGLSAVLVVDAEAVAREIVAASSRPLVTYRLTPIEDEA